MMLGKNNFYPLKEHGSHETTFSEQKPGQTPVYRWDNRSHKDANRVYGAAYQVLHKLIDALV